MTDIRVGAVAVKALRRETTNRKLLTGQVAVKVLRAYLPEEEPPPADQEEPTTPFTGQIWPRPEELSEDGVWAPGDSEVSSNPGVFGTWLTKTAMTSSRAGQGGGVIGGKFYVVGGHSSASQANSTATLYCYDPVANSWSTKAPMPAERTQFAATCVVNGKLYVVGGLGPAGSSTVQAATYCYDPNSNSWTTKAPLPVALRWGALGNAVIGNKFYVIGGQDAASHSFNTVYCYDTTTNTWSTKAPYPRNISLSAVSVLGGKLYVAGGTDAASSQTDVNCYDPTTDVWTAKAPMPTVMSDRPGMSAGGRFVIPSSTDLRSYDPGTDTWTVSALTLAANFGSAGGVDVDSATGQARLLVAGGNTSTTTSSALQSLVVPDYVSGSNSFGTSWSAGPSLPISLTRFGTFVIDKVIYVCGGRTSGGNASRRVFALDTRFATPVWVEKAKMPSARTDVYSGIAGKKGYIIGGRNFDGDQVRTVYRYNPKTNTWVSKALMPSARSSKGVSAHKIGTDGKLYVAGGDRDGVRKNTLFIYNAAKDLWTTGPQMPVAVSGNVICARGTRGKIYSISGQAVGTSGLYVYDPITKAWTTLLSPGVDKTTGSYACVVAGKLVLSGVGPLTTDTPIMWNYDIDTNVWTSGVLPNNPANGRGSGLVAVSGKMYLIGGSSWSSGDTTRATKQVWTIPVPTDVDEVFTPADSIGQVWPRENVLPPAGHWETSPIVDPSTPWAQLPSSQRMPYSGATTVKITEASTYVVNGIVYIFGGRLSGVYKSDVWAYNPSAQTWTQKASMPFIWSSSAGGGVLDGKVYLAGGESSSSSQNLNVLIYDTSTNTWSTGAAMPAASSSVGCNGSTIINRKLYVAGGLASGASTFRATLQEYDIDTNTWATKAPMPQGRNRGAFFAIGTSLYYIGGVSTVPVINTSMDTVYRWDQPTNTWVILPPMPMGPSVSMFSPPRVGTDVYLLGGQEFDDRWYRFDTLTETFSEMPNRPPVVPRYQGFFVNIGGGQLLAGGFEFDTDKALLYRYDVRATSDPGVPVDPDLDPVWVDEPPTGLLWA